MYVCIKEKIFIILSYYSEMNYVKSKKFVSQPTQK